MIEGQNFISHDAFSQNPSTDLSKKFSRYETDAQGEITDVKITQEDVRVYVQDILTNYKNFATQNQQDVGLTYIIESFVPEKIMNLGLAKDSDIALTKIQSGILQEIGRQLEINEDFKDLKKDNVLLGVLKEYGSNSVVKFVSARQEKFVLKEMQGDDTDFNKEITKARNNFLQLASEDAAKGELPPYIVLPKKMTTDGQKLLSPNKKMVILEDFLPTLETHYTSQKDPAEQKKIVRSALEKIVKMLGDFAKGLTYIKDKGFVLMDIDATNIGYDVDDRHGLVFDLDALLQRGHKSRMRTFKHSYFQHFNMQGGDEIDPQEMVFQLGVALIESANRVADFAQNVLTTELKAEIEKIRALAFSMIQPKANDRGYNSKTDPHFDERPTLEECVTGLEKIYNRLEQLA